MDLWDAFASRVDQQPAAPALIWQGEETSYGELLDLAERTRGRLDELAPDDDEPIAILATKSPTAIALILACLMARRRFLLLPPTLPESSRQAVLAQAGCRHVLSPEATLPPSGEWARLASSRPAEPSDVSFMLTTSGSTGFPKIVPHSVGTVDRFTDWAGEQFGMGPGKTVLNYAPLNFVVCLLDIWATLKHGGRVVLVEPDLSTDARYLIDLLLRHEVNVIQAVPMFYQLLIHATRERPERFDAVEHVISTGDSIPVHCLKDLAQMFGQARLYNAYGCTETIASFIHEVTTTEPPESALPLGRPLPGVHAMVVAVDGTVLHGPGTGELYVATPFQTTGYVGMARDADRFVPHPQGHDHVRYFRTGDMVRRSPEGGITVVGRNDFEVKVRGVRINIQEVERVLLAHQEVVEAAVVAVPDPVAGRVLHSVVRRTPTSRLNSLALRHHCARRLPREAIPSTVEVVGHPLPKTSTGKLDRNLVERVHISRVRTKEA